MTGPARRSGTRQARHRAPRAARFAGLGLALVALGGCGSDDGDPTAFCAAVDDLRADDPFADLAVASPGEMRDAFDALAGGAERIEQVAPADVEVQAQRYVDAVDALRDELAAAAWNPTRVDTGRYGDAVATYGEAATSLDNAADAMC